MICRNWTHFYMIRSLHLWGRNSHLWSKSLLLLSINSHQFSQPPQIDPICPKLQTLFSQDQSNVHYSCGDCQIFKDICHYQWNEMYLLNWDFQQRKHIIAVIVRYDVIENRQQYLSILNHCIFEVFIFFLCLICYPKIFYYIE